MRHVQTLTRTCEEQRGEDEAVRDSLREYSHVPQTNQLKLNIRYHGPQTVALIGTGNRNIDRKLRKGEKSKSGIKGSFMPTSKQKSCTCSASQCQIRRVSNPQ